jgi:hypothetical protein
MQEEALTSSSSCTACSVFVSVLELVFVWELVSGSVFGV